MLLGARLLSGVNSVNNFIFTPNYEASAGNAFDLYFQLTDREQHKTDQGFSPAGLRYIPGAGATVSVTALNLDASKVLTRTATKPFAGDTSIWKVSFLASDPLTGTISLKITLVEGGVVRTVAIQAAVLVDGQNEVC